MYQDRQASFSATPQHFGAFMPAPAPLRVGLLGLGIVGTGTYQVLARNADIISARTGRRIEIVMVFVRNLARAASILTNDVVVVDDPLLVVNHPNVDVVVEVIGGTTIAKDLVLQAIANGKHVVTANKALLAEHGSEIFAAAHAQGVVVAYEGAVAVSIPIIKVLREGLSANRIEWVAGIINGTTNYILSRMKTQSLSFGQALAEAQRLGYAEADPTFDVKGIDAAHKLTLLASNAFGVPIQFDKVHTEGINDLELADVTFAERLGFCVKLLGIAKRNSSGLELRVHPTLIPTNHLLANVHDSMNAVMVKSDAAGLTMHYGAGAGSEQTASAVIADLVDLCRSFETKHQHRVPSLAFQQSAITAIHVREIADVMTCYYLRLDLINSAKFEQDVMDVLLQAGIRIWRLEVVKHPIEQEFCTMLALTKPVRNSVIHGAISKLGELPAVKGHVRSIRIETLD